jgi:3-oxoacyl-[acyl-carrier protein] reductase
VADHAVVPPRPLEGAAVLVVGDPGWAVTPATAQAFLDAGARVAFAPDIAPEVGSPTPLGGPGELLPSFERGAAGAEAAVTGCLRRLGGLDACVRLLAPTRGPTLLDADARAWADDVEHRLLDSVRLARAAARAMADRGGGSIVVAGPVDAMHAYQGRSGSAVVMGGLLGLVRAIAVELSGAGVRANAVIVGPVGDPDRVVIPGAPAELVERTRLRVPLHRWGTPAEAAAAIRFVAGPDAAFMTGQTIRVDGGWASLNQAPEGMTFR